MNDIIKHKIDHNLNRAKTSVKWVVFAVISGIVVGFAVTLFYFGLSFVTQIRSENPWLLFLLPVGGLFIVGSYRLLRIEKDIGTNLVISTIQSNDDLPLRMAPLIFFSTLVTHLFGGSAGRVGATLQLGGSIGNGIGKLFRFDDNDKHIMIMCGMSAGFSVLFGTPMTAAIFPMEVVSVGIMHYSALVPCVISSLVAKRVAASFGILEESFLIASMPDFTLQNAILITVLAVLCALVSILFCILLHQSEQLYKRFFKNPYLRVFAGGCIVIVLTLLVGDQRYSGTGMTIIDQCFEGKVHPEAFLLKMIFTAVTLGAGFRGGEIAPTFCVGATFGCLFGNLIGFSPTLCAAIGMTAMFCGVTNCPITSLLISFELFGYDGMPYFLLTVAFSYMLSGYYGLYHSQKIVYSKYKTHYINKKTL